jgi:hypothetical protein
MRVPILYTMAPANVDEDLSGLFFVFAKELANDGYAKSSFEFNKIT